MNKYIVFGKSGVTVPVDVMSATASEEIGSFMEQGFTILSDSCEAANAEEAIATWESQLKSKDNFEFVKTSSTNSISSDLEIIENHGVITTTVVAGTNFLRDILAGVRDIVGGQSGSYNNKLDQIKSNALLGLRKQAASKSCNAIVGVSIDVDEVSGGGKSMFMVTAIGTAVVVEKRQTSV
ncbi:YbjQ family protein [Vibrio parahaemolyticus]|uniref:YbjQ family protein n=1 Tax=Vibrio parahaemolyticus TaxID=670 RepID=UPI00226A9DFD|nr:YbjQ family protein [Vibrio parahaemolyticus]EIU6823011.1 YbjQ family protein [Vibrio parahaemolyticus]MCX8813043.1 YbjQ family protein [Vibrio parahaemolyticus]MCX8835546.1 YbjQ family protein [Vibrio parahaemolyticus]MCX8909176.1 YbjQ family protein [Vibrio parahaemolyticus]